jgi:hypothetical protein
LYGSAVAKPGAGSVVRRAAPRLTCTAVCLAGVIVTRSSSLVWLWVAALIGVATPLLTSGWWHTVRAGTPPPSYGILDELPDGRWRLVLHSPGDKPVQVVKAVRELTGMDLLTAKNLVDGAPREVARGLSEIAAQRGVELLDGAGAVAVAQPPQEQPMTRTV